MNFTSGLTGSMDTSMNKAWPKLVCGQRFGKLVVIRELPEKDKYNHLSYELHCDCGGIRIADKMAVVKGKIQYDCGCGREQNREEAYFDFLYDGCKRGAESRNLSFLLSPSEHSTLVKKPCYYCGVDASFRKGIYKNLFKYPRKAHGVDRIDNSKGYILENCVPCCSICNKAKRTMTVEEFRAWVKRVHDHPVRVLIPV